MTADAIADLLQPYLAGGGAIQLGIYSQLVVYIELILKWNARINLTAIRTPEEIIRRHFGESLFLAAHLGTSQSLLDFGSGAGFPGLPIQLLHPDISVTLSESRNKKAAFLLEVIRTLGLSTEVWAGRVEEMPASRQFDAVTLRAVNNMEAAIQQAAHRARQLILVLGTTRTTAHAALAANFAPVEAIPLPSSDDGVLLIARRR